MTEQCDVEVLWDAVAGAEGAELVTTLSHLSHHLIEEGRTEEALAAIDAATAVLVSQGCDGNLGQLHFDAAGVLRHLGRLGEALDRYESAARAYDDRFARLDALHCRTHAIEVVAEMGRTEEAIARLDAVAAELIAEGAAGTAAGCLVDAAQLLLDGGAAEAALERCEEARPLAIGAGDPLLVAQCDIEAARALDALDRAGDALAGARSAVAILDALGEDDRVAEVRILQADLMVDAGLAGEAYDLLGQIREERRSAGDPASVARCDVASARALAVLGDRREAVAVAHDAAAVLDALDLGDEAAGARTMAVQWRPARRRS